MLISKLYEFLDDNCIKIKTKLSILIGRICKIDFIFMKDFEIILIFFFFNFLYMMIKLIIKLLFLIVEFFLYILCEEISFYL